MLFVVVSRLVKIDDQSMTRPITIEIPIDNSRLPLKAKVMDSLSFLLKSGHCSEMLLLIAIQFHTNQPMSVVEFVRSTLSLPVSIRKMRLFFLLI